MVCLLVCIRALPLLIVLGAKGSLADSTPLPKVVKGLNEDPVRQARKQKKPVKKASGHPDDLDWINEELTDLYEPMANPGSGDTAQVCNHEVPVTLFVKQFICRQGSSIFIH